MVVPALAATKLLMKKIEAPFSRHRRSAWRATNYAPYLPPTPNFCECPHVSFNGDHFKNREAGRRGVDMGR